MIFVTALIFIGLLLILVLVHEWGHFIAAKKAGCTVEEFGFGFPPRLASFSYHGTRYSLNLLPIGGFVRIEGEDMQEAHPSPRSFASKSATWRVIILAAGVFMNVVLASVFLMIQAGIGYPTVVTEDNVQALRNHQTYIVDVAPDSPAAQAGILALDRIVRIDTLENPALPQVQDLVKARAGSTVHIEVDRQGQRQQFELVPRINPPVEQGALGVSLAAVGLERVPWYQAPWVGLRRTGEMLLSIVTQFGLILQRLVTQGTVGEALTGPVGLAVYTNEIAKLGISYILEFGALISLNLAIINILPLPALDGGRIMFVLLEKLRGRRLSARIEQMTHAIGFGLLILLMLLITFRDIRKFF